MRQADAALRVERNDLDAAAPGKWSVLRSQSSSEAMRKLNDATKVASAPRDAPAVNKPEVAAVDFAKERLAKKVLADSSEGASNNWAVFRAEAPSDAMQQGDATRRVLDAEDAAAAPGNWSVFRSQASSEAMRKLNDATKVASAPRDAPAVNKPEVAVVDFAKELLAKKVLADSSEGASNN